jgi:hypothetical protein
MAGKIFIRVLLLALILWGLNWVYNATLFHKDLMKKSEQVIEILQSQEISDVFYFAESSNFNTRAGDSLQQSISEIANFFYPSLKIRAINKAATHAGIFRNWLEVIDLKRKRPSAVIITMNLRSFDATWIHSKLETQLQETTVLTWPYPKIVNRFLLSLQAFDNKTEQQRELDMFRDWEHAKLEFPFPFKYHTVKEWDNAMAMGGHLKPDGSWDQPKIELACHYIKAYAFNINDDNPRVKDFDAIADWCARNGMPLYLNLLAENVQYADSLVGKELVFLMKRNRDYLVKRYNKGNCKVIDNLELVNGREFTDQTWTTEHYGYKGRMAIAKNLAEGLRAQFNNSYIKAY